MADAAGAALGEAKELGELPPDTDPAQLAFELQALLAAANTSFMLHGNAAVFARARETIRERLTRHR